MSDTSAEPLTEAEMERDMWMSWWLAHRVIGADVREGRRELPAIFRPSTPGETDE